MTACVRGIGMLLSFCLLCGFAPGAEKRDRSFYEKTGDIVWEVPMEARKIALTFDDGPYPETTGDILDLLKEYDGKATFFVVGHRAEEAPELVRRELAEGHEIGNHTYTHLFLKKSVNPQTVFDEISRTEETLTRLTGAKPTLFRPPGGYYNDPLIELTKKLGYRTVLWSWHQDTKDWRSPGVAAIANKVLTNARAGDIVLLHDCVQGSTQTVQALRIILPELSRRGFRFVTVSELLRDRARLEGGDGSRLPVPQPTPWGWRAEAGHESNP